MPANRTAAPLVLLLSLVACGQQPSAPRSEMAPDFAASALDKNIVFRFQDHIAAAWSDDNSSLRAVHTTFPIVFDKLETDCGPQADLALIDYKRVGVVNPVDFFFSDFHMKATGPVWIFVRDLSQPGDCYGAKLVAEGPGELRYVDNDVFGVAPGEFAKNEWGFKASGTLTTPDRRTLSYHGTARYTIKAAGGEPEFTRVLERISLQ
jgi:hypothetical protein